VDSNFLNWKDEAGEKGTAALVARTRKTYTILEVELKLNEKEDWMVVKSGEWKVESGKWRVRT
jgi:hypothetical protein